jgi:predicted MFS family arabinose efflux permease
VALATSELRRVYAAWGAVALGKWAFFVLLAIYAFEHGGASAVGLAVLARMLPAGVTALFTSVLADRRSRRDLLLAATLVRALALALIAVAVEIGAPFALVLVLAAVQTIAGSAAKPAQAALLPLLARSPEQLAAANTAWNVIDSAGFCVGALLGGVMAAGVGLTAGFAATAAACLLAAVIQRRLPRDAPPPHREAHSDARLAGEVLAGFRAVLAERRLGLVVAALSVTTLAEGAIDVLVVVLALDVLDTGRAGVGWLNAAWGIGGILGGGAAVALLGGGRLASGLGCGCLLVAAALAGIASWPAAAPALVLLGALGVGYALIEIAGLTLSQRLADDEVLARVQGVLESTYVVTTAVGSALGALAIGLLGVDGTLLLVGGALALLALIAGRRLARCEASVPIPEREYTLLRALGIFAPLPIATLETLAARLEPVPLTAGEVIVREGAPGDRCYLVAEGEIALSKQTGWHTSMGPGDFFGEIALLRDTPRTATARAVGPGLLLALDRADFLPAVTGHARTQQAADTLVSKRVDSHKGESHPDRGATMHAD